MPPKLNDTYICLIPKTKNPQKITDFRPISLCNVMYRILAKVLANRLKKILPEVVNKSQSAFVPRRLITDNVLVAFELMYHINQKRKGKDGQMAIKLDMSKAFDRVEWECLARIMQKLGFHDRWISIIMMCISTVSYSVLINGKPKGEIIPSRGIRQGDPLSPFLFLLCAKGLSAMLQKEERLGSIKGISICRGAPHISHLFFANDSIIFCRANMGDCRRIWDVLQNYGAASGQKINKDKTSLFFSKNTIASVQAEIKCLFGAQVIKQHDRYLGLPSLIGRGKKKAFNRIKDQLSRKLAGWKGKLLSAAGKEILIKAVAQATPTYTMSCFKLLDSLCKDLSSLVSKFWWGQKSDERKIPWVSWDKLCKSKNEGGMGFRDLKAFNLALLAKQGWRLLQNTNSLFHHVFQAKYFAGRSFLDAQIGKRPSYAWRSIMAAKSVVEDGIRWSIGNGESVLIWQDKWIPKPDTYKITTPINPLFSNEKVSTLIDTEQAVWKSDRINSIFLPHDAESILSIPLSATSPVDHRVWSPTANGLFSVRSAYWICHKKLAKLDVGECSNSTKMISLWKLVWQLRCPNKIKNFIWRACKDILPTKTKLRDRKIPLDVACDICGEAETAGHVLWGCELAAAVWQMANFKAPGLTTNSPNFLD